MERTRETEWTLKPIDWVALVVLIIGGLNWGLVGLFEFDLIAALFGEMTAFTRILYTIVGFAALWSIIGLATHLHYRSVTATRTPPAVIP